MEVGYRCFQHHTPTLPSLRWAVSLRCQRLWNKQNFCRDPNLRSQAYGMLRPTNNFRRT